MSISGPVGIAKQRPSPLLLQLFQTSFTQEEFAQLVEDQSRSGGSRIVHMDCPEAPPQFARVRPSKQSFSFRYSFDSVFRPDPDFI